MGNWKIAVIRGIPIQIHWTFVLLLVFFGWQAGSWPAAALVVVNTLLLFGCVVLHELGHSIAAQRFGIGVRGILLLPLGGLAQLERLPERPGQELVIALAGPAVNVLIVITLSIIDVLSPASMTLGLSPKGIEAYALANNVLSNLMLANVVLALFNLIPAFPLDGGRVLRALLDFVTTRERATFIALWVGRVFALGFVAVGIVTRNVFLPLVGLFVLLGGSEEYRMVSTQARLRRLSAADATRPVPILHPLDLLGQIAPDIMRAPQPLYPVAAGDGVLGGMTPYALWQGLQQFGPAATAQQIADPHIPIVASNLPLLDLHDWMSKNQAPIVIVADSGHPVGIALWDDVRKMAGD